MQDIQEIHPTAHTTSQAEMEHKLRSPDSQPIGLGLLHGAMHLPTIKRLLIDLLLSIVPHCGIYLLQSVGKVMILYQSYSGKRIALRYKLLSTS